MRRFSDIPIRRKLMLVILLACTTVLALAGVVLVAIELVTFRRTMVADLTILADVLAQNSTAAMKFADEAAAQQTLASLRAEPHIVAAGLYSPDGGRFAAYTRADAPAGAEPDLPARPQADGHHFDGDRLALFRPVELNQRRIGTIYLQADLGKMYDRLKLYTAVLCAVMVGAVLVTLALSRVLQRPISGPILALAETARAAADRKDYSIRADKRGRDEIGLLTDAFNQMLGDFRDQTQQVAESISTLTTAARDILGSATHLAAISSQTATAVAQTTTTVEEVRQTATVSTQKAKFVSESSQRAASISQAGKRSTAETAGGMGRIRDQMGSIASSMVRLGEQTQAIGQIIATVDDLAQQSNLLAVNASIEAAKAGDQGKGFAVVAQEVKSLAEQSRAATTQVRQILADIQKATAAAALATDQGAKAVDAGLAQSARAGESILALADGVNEAAQAASQIAASSQQQLVGMDQVAQAMESIKQASTQNVDSAKQLEAAARSLDDLGRRLKELVGRYKV